MKSRARSTGREPTKPASRRRLDAISNFEIRISDLSQRSSSQRDDCFPWHRRIFPANDHLNQAWQRCVVCPPIKPCVPDRVEITNLQGPHIFNERYPAFIRV